MESSLCHTKQTQEIESKTLIWREISGDYWLHLPGMVLTMDKTTGVVTIKSGGQHILPDETFTATLKNLTDDTAKVLPQTEKVTVLNVRKFYILTVCSMVITQIENKRVTFDTWIINFEPNTN